MSPRTALIATAAAAALLLALPGCSSAAPSSANAPAAPVADTSAADAPVEQTADAAVAPDAPGLNTPVTVGSLEFTALGITEIGTTIGESPLSQDAQGTFLQLDLKVANVGNKSETFLDTYVKLVDAAGNTYDADSMAAVYLQSDAKTWLSGINPGNAVEGPVIFDVPVGTQPVAVQVTDNMFKKGETIELK